MLDHTLSEERRLLEEVFKGIITATTGEDGNLNWHLWEKIREGHRKDLIFTVMRYTETLAVASQHHVGQTNNFNLQKFKFNGGRHERSRNRGACVSTFMQRVSSQSSTLGNELINIIIERREHNQGCALTTVVTTTEEDIKAHVRGCFHLKKASDFLETYKDLVAKEQEPHVVLTYQSSVEPFQELKMDQQGWNHASQPGQSSQSEGMSHAYICSQLEGLTINSRFDDDFQQYDAGNNTTTGGQGGQLVQVQPERSEQWNRGFTTTTRAVETSIRKAILDSLQAKIVQLYFSLSEHLQKPFEARYKSFQDYYNRNLSPQELDQAEALAVELEREMSLYFPGGLNNRFGV